MLAFKVVKNMFYRFDFQIPIQSFIAEVFTHLAPDLCQQPFFIFFSQLEIFTT